MTESAHPTETSQTYVEDLFNIEGSEDITGQSDVVNFYEGCNVLITGGSGFLGKVLVEKLLRSCPNMGKLYMLIRPKKGKDPDERFKEIFDNVLFDTLKRQNPNFKDHIVVIEGDTGKEDLGLSPESRATLVENVHVVFNAAASIRFDEELRKAIRVNVRSVKMMLMLAREMKNLKAFIHVSTAYSHSHRDRIEEKFYQPGIEVDRMIKLADILDEEGLAKIGPALLKEWANVYTFTKALGEEALREYGRDLPVCLVRPSICISTANEPIRGWSDCLYGATGIAIGGFLCVLRVVQCEGEKIADLIPIDYVVNTMIVTAWDTARNWKEKFEMIPIETKEEPKVFNTVTSPQNPVSWHDFLTINQVYGMSVPSTMMVWYHFMLFVRTKFMWDIYIIFLHLLPGAIMDFLAKMSGQKPILMKTYKKIHKYSEVTAWFSTREWNFSNANVQELWREMSPVDKKMFNFNVSSFDWDEYSMYHMRGIRVYTIKDPMETLDAGRAKVKKLKILHYSVVLLYYVFVAWIVTLFARLILSFF